MVLNNLVKSLDLVDILRLQHHSKGQYSFFSAQLFMEAHFILEDIKVAIHSFPNSKVCGSSRLRIETYKAHTDLVAPLLLSIVNRSVIDGIFPKTLYDTHIYLLLKRYHIIL